MNEESILLPQSVNISSPPLTDFVNNKPPQLTIFTNKESFQSPNSPADQPSKLSPCVSDDTLQPVKSSNINNDNDISQSSNHVNDDSPCLPVINETSESSQSDESSQSVSEEKPQNKEELQTPNSEHDKNLESSLSANGEFFPYQRNESSDIVNHKSPQSMNFLMSLDIYTLIPLLYYKLHDVP